MFLSLLKSKKGKAIRNKTFKVKCKELDFQLKDILEYINEKEDKPRNLCVHCIVKNLHKKEDLGIKSMCSQSITFSYF